MPGTTPSGLPYPLPSEPVRDGAVAIRNLAEKLDPRAPYGQMVINQNQATNGDGYFSINAPGNFIAAAIGYAGVFQPIVINVFNSGGTGVGFKAWGVSGGNWIPIASTTISITGVIFYSA